MTRADGPWRVTPIRYPPGGRLQHHRALVAIDKQGVIRMNRDSLCSSGAFDLDAGPVTIELPNTGMRFRPLVVLGEDQAVSAAPW